MADMKSQEHFTGFPGVMIRDFRDIPRGQLRQEECERRKTIRETIRRKGRQPPVASEAVSIQRSTQVRECKKELHMLMTTLTGEVSSNLPAEQSKQKSSRIKRIRNAVRKGTSILEVEVQKATLSTTQHIGMADRKLKNSQLNFPGIMHRDVRKIPRKQGEQEERERSRIIREAIRAVGKKGAKLPHLSLGPLEFQIRPHPNLRRTIVL